MKQRCFGPLTLTFPDVPWLEILPVAFSKHLRKHRPWPVRSTHGFSSKTSTNPEAWTMKYGLWRKIYEGTRRAQVSLSQKTTTRNGFIQLELPN